jgi:hypothetical protein
MISIRNSLGRCIRPLLAVLIVGLVPMTGRAEKVMFRNECRSPVVVQIATDNKGILRKDEPILLRYGDCTAKIKTNVDRLVTIYDNKTNRVLFRDVLKANKKEQYYSIVFDPRRPGRVQLILRPAKVMPKSKPR